MLNGTLNKFNIKEGRVAFEIKKNEIDWKNNQLIKLVKLTQNGNFVLLEKTELNKLKFSYLDIETGTANLEIEINDLSTEQDYIFILSWSVQNKTISLYINGIARGTGEIVPIK
jgi:hypothetical protein